MSHRAPKGNKTGSETGGDEGRMPMMRRRTVLTSLAVTGLGLAGAGVVTATAAPPSKSEDPDLGPNVSVFGPDTSASAIKDKVNAVFGKQEKAQFGKGRHAFLFKPGKYKADVNVGFYTQVLGLGLTPDDVQVKGSVHAEADWFDGNATQNFWRSAEGVCVTPSGEGDRWAVSQAAPYRRMHVKGDLALDDGGWSSGGLLADTVVDGQVKSGSQQQWLSRNAELGSWDGANWNMVFVGVKNAPKDSFPKPPYTTVDAAPRMREKPYLYVNDAGEYRVFAPELRENASGTSWSGGKPKGKSIPLSDFHIAKEGDSAADLNKALAGGKHLLLTPGIYEIDEALAVNKAGTIVLGLGLATLTPTKGNAAVTVANVAGVRVAGILIDAGTKNSKVLMQIGPKGAKRRHADDPISLHDVFVRVGGAVAGKATTSLVINSSNVIADHLWLWRGDHGEGIGWDTNPAETGLIVNGSGVTAYGLFVEHYQKHQVIWNGENGRTYFFQNEMPYDPPNQDAWMNGKTRGYAAYKVADSVSKHEAWGMGSYCFFDKNPSVVADHAIEAPEKPGVRFHHVTAVSLGGKGTITHVVNKTGGPADSKNNQATVSEYPG